MRERERLLDGWPVLLLLWSMVMVAAVAILHADLIDGLHILPIVSTLGLLAGWLLAKSRFSDRTAHLFALIYGLFFVFFLVGHALPYTEPWRERVTDLIVRQFEWLQKAVDGGTSRDGTIFVIQTTVVFWVLSYLAGWYTFRKQHVWRVVVPTGLVLLSVVYYYNGPRPLLFYLAIYTLLALVFVALTHLTDQERNWRASSVRYDRGIQFDFLRAGMLASLLALLLAWSVPTLKASPLMSQAVSGASGPWRSFQDTWTRLFSSLRSYGTGASDPYQETLVLGGPRSVGETLIMDIHVPQEIPYGIYWQAMIYDTYEDGGWRTAPPDGEPFLHYPDDGPLNVPFTLDRTVITQTVTNFLPNSSLIYAVPEVVDSNRQMYVDASTDADGRTMVSSLRSRFILRQGDQYQVTSQVSTADATKLRQASRAYPDWVRERYLQLPESITPETLVLAESLTAGLDNPYDMSVAVRDYLRTNIDYNDQIEAAPEGVEPVHYTLFDIEEAYCTYYSSAMAVMLRSRGVPARVVSGFAMGDYNQDSHTYRVRAENSHTWVEVYFPNYGWIQFEPTQSIPVFERPSSSGEGEPATAAAAAPVLDQEPFPLDEGENDPERATSLSADGPDRGVQGLFGGVAWWQVALGAVIIVAAAVVLYLANAYNRRVEADVDRSFARLGSWAGWLDIVWRANQTPYEQAEELVSAVPEGQRPIRSLTHQYVYKRFSPSRQIDSGFSPAAEWRALRPLLLKQTISHYLDRLRRSDRA